jgi:hypothetical protein
MLNSRHQAYSYWLVTRPFSQVHTRSCIENDDWHLHSNIYRYGSITMSSQNRSQNPLACGLSLFLYSKLFWIGRNVEDAMRDVGDSAVGRREVEIEQVHPAATKPTV